MLVTFLEKTFAFKEKKETWATTRGATIVPLPTPKFLILRVTPPSLPASLQLSWTFALGGRLIITAGLATPWLCDINLPSLKHSQAAWILTRRAGISWHVDSFWLPLGANFGPRAGLCLRAGHTAVACWSAPSPALSTMPLNWILTPNMCIWIFVWCEHLGAPFRLMRIDLCMGVMTLKSQFKSVLLPGTQHAHAYAPGWELFIEGDRPEPVSLLYLSFVLLALALYIF